MTCASTALIVGGGIAGLSAAIALGRRGVHCDVVEIADEPLGASLGLSGRAAEALSELGVYDACHSTGRPFSNNSTILSAYNAAGELISAGPQRPNWPDAKDNIAVYRPVFLDILGETAAGLGVNVRRRVTVEAIEYAAATAAVTFTDGCKGLYDFVVGADGIGSLTRRLVFPDAPSPAYAGQWSIRWMAPGPAVQDEGQYDSPLGKIGFYYLPHQELVYVAAVVPLAETKRLTDREVISMFTALLDSYSAPAMVELRRRLRHDSALIGRPFEWILVPAPWHRGGTVLIGDAAHATTAQMGMGGGMAIEDAVVLGQCIESADTLAEAFGAFMVRRFDRVKTVVETSLNLSRLEQAKAPRAESVPVLTAGLQALGQPY